MPFRIPFLTAPRLLLGIMLTLAACLADRAPEPRGTTPLTIDSSKATYTLRVANIINTNCAISSACHASGAGNLLDFTTYNQVKRSANDELSRFYCRIHQEPGCSKMPQGGGRLADSLLTYLDIWKLRNYPE